MDDKHKIAMKGRFVLVSVYPERAYLYCVFFGMKCWRTSSRLLCEKSGLKKKSAYLSDDAMTHSCNLSYMSVCQS